MSEGTEPKHAGGRPLKFPSVDELDAKIDAYFRECDREEDTRVFAHGASVEEEHEEIVKGKRVATKRLVCERCRREPTLSRGCIVASGELKLRRPYTVTGLAVWLDTSRQTLNNYEVRPEFFDSIKRAKQRVENYAKEAVRQGCPDPRGHLQSEQQRGRLG